MTNSRQLQFEGASAGGAVPSQSGPSRLPLSSHLIPPLAPQPPLAFYAALGAPGDSSAPLRFLASADVRYVVCTAVDPMSLFTRPQRVALTSAPPRARHLSGRYGTPIRQQAGVLIRQPTGVRDQSASVAVCGSFRAHQTTSPCLYQTAAAIGCVRCRQTDRQTDTQTDRQCPV